MGGLDGFWATVLPAADGPYPSTFSFTGRGTTLLPDGTFHFHSLRQRLNSNLNTSATQICTCHQLLHPQVLQLLIKLFETEHSQLDVMEQVCCVTLIASYFSFQQKLVCCDCVASQLTVCWFYLPPQLELKKTLLDRMVHLLSRGYVLPVVGYIRKCLEKLNTDISLIRYFVTEVIAASDLATATREWILDLGYTGCVNELFANKFTILTGYCDSQTYIYRLFLLPPSGRKKSVIAGLMFVKWSYLIVCNHYLHKDL